MKCPTLILTQAQIRAAIAQAFTIYENSQSIFFTNGAGRTKIEVSIQLWIKVPGNNSNFKLIS